MPMSATILLTPLEIFTQSETSVRLAVTAQQDLNSLSHAHPATTIRINKRRLKATAYRALLAVIVMARLI